jgi:hypothetical protein
MDPAVLADPDERELGGPLRSLDHDLLTLLATHEGGADG